MTDTGIGIAASDLPRLFERFHRIEGARARTHEGSGIGLALVHDLVKLHGGRVSVASEVGRGSTFTVSIPFGSNHLPAQGNVGAPAPVRPSQAVRAQSFVAEALRWSPEADAEPDAAGAVQATSTFPGAHVLFVDDNADMREYVTRLLRQHWTVETATDGAQALLAARQRRPDLILTDVMMPVLDGLQLLQSVRSDPPPGDHPGHLAVGPSGRGVRIEGLEAGADDYLVKPFSARELVARVGTQITLTRLREESARERAALFAREQAARREAELQKQHLVSLLMQAPTPMLILRGPEHLMELANADDLPGLGSPPR